ncbi:MAG: hypothetical protein ACYCW6_25640 [Candidatus Xenobia bacterium]
MAERTVVTLAFLATAVVLLLNVHGLGQYASMVVGGLMSVLGVIASSWFAAHRAQSAEAAAPAAGTTSTATGGQAAASAAATPGSLLDNGNRGHAA